VREKYLKNQHRCASSMKFYAISFLLGKNWPKSVKKWMEGMKKARKIRFVCRRNFRNLELVQGACQPLSPSHPPTTSPTLSPYPNTKWIEKALGENFCANFPVFPF
jgi:hypothetical protein